MEAMEEFIVQLKQSVQVTGNQDTIPERSRVKIGWMLHWEKQPPACGWPCREEPGDHTEGR